MRKIHNWGDHVELEIASMWTERELEDKLYSAVTQVLAVYEQMWEEKKLPEDHDGSFRIKLPNDNIFVSFNVSDTVKRSLLKDKYKDVAQEIVDIVKEEGAYEDIRLH